MNGKQIDQLVFNYQQGDSASGEELLTLFAGSSSCIQEDSYLGKYYRILRSGHVLLADKDTRSFLGMYISNEQTRKHFLSFSNSQKSREIGSYLLTTVRELYEPISDEDLQQDLILLFLQQAMRFEKKEKHIYFTGYLYNSYRYALRIYLEKTYGYIFEEKEFELYEDDTYEDINGDFDIDERDWIETPRLSFEQDGEFGNSWVRGLTCHPLFLVLTPIERIIISQWYVERKTDKDIAEMIGMNETTIFHKRKRAIEKLKGAGHHDEVHEL